MTALEEQNKLILEQFKSRIEDCDLINHSDVELENWLIVNNYNINEANQALRKTLEWRKINEIDDLLNSGFEIPEVFKKYFSLGRCGYDKFKCPIWLSVWGRNDFKGLVQCVSKKDASKVVRYFMETALKEIRALGVDKVSAVIDMENLSIKQICHKRGLEVIFEIVSTLETHYPNRMRKVLVINAQAVLPILFKIVKPFVNKTTMEKICIYGTDKDEWTSALLAEIDSDQLPAYYGGTLTDSNGDPKCPHLFNMGGQVPRHYYLSNKLPVPKEGMDSITIIAGVGGFKKIKFKVLNPNSFMSWEFMSEGGDLAYYIYYKSPNEGIVELVPLDRVDSHLNMEIGQITCEKTGKYVFVFDNTFSYVQVKKIHYNIQVELPSKINVVSTGERN